MKKILLALALFGYLLTPQPTVAAALDRPAYKEGEVLVKWKPTSKSTSRLHSQKSDLQLDTVQEYPELSLSRVALEADESVSAKIAELEASPLVEYAEPNYYVYPDLSVNDTYFATRQWGLNNTGQSIRNQTGTVDQDTNTYEAWDIEIGSSAVVVAVIDTGVQIAHPDLDANIWVNTDEVASNGLDDDGNGYIDDRNGYDFKNNNASVFDSGNEDYHGTHVSGIIAAELNNSAGIAGIAQVKVMPVKALEQTSGGLISDIIDAVDYAAANGASVVNMSFGTSSYSQSFKDKIDSYPNVLFITSAGNTGANIDSSPQYPASFTSSNLITVAALDNQGSLASFTDGSSNYGVTAVDIGAPGKDIYSTLPTDAFPAGYGWMSGTSQAAPHVTGAAALLKSYSSSLTTATIRTYLLDNGDAISSLSGKSVTGDRLNVDAALEEIVNDLTKNDLWLTLGSNTGTGNVETHILDGSTNFQTFLAQMGTALPAAPIGTTGLFYNVGDWNNDSILDLQLTLGSNTGTGNVETHILDGSTNFQTFLAQMGTALPAAPIGTTGLFYNVGDWNNDDILDLWLILGTNTGTGNVETHILDGSTNFQTFLAQMGTALPAAPIGTTGLFYNVGDWNNDSILDLQLTLGSNTGTGNVETHILDGSTNFQTFLAQMGTALPAAPIGTTGLFYNVGDWN